MNYLITIIGPTAIGKTSLSIVLAQHFGCDIISCDSRQFYKEMRIGTAVPSDKELAIVTHHFIENKSIFDNYTVGDFEKETIVKLNELFLKNSIQIMVGGSGLYVNAILKGIDDFPEIDNSVRIKINADFEQFGIDYLQQKLKKLDLDYYHKIKVENPQTLQNPQRMKRFVEVCIATGKPYSSFLNQKNNRRNFTPIIIGLEAKREIMYDRIDQRVDLMITKGLFAEAEGLFKNKQLNALQTVGYKELFDFFESKTSLDFAIQEIKKNTRRFSKRQMTWFKKTEKVLWFDYLTKSDDIINSIENTIK
ncbi:tRNA (adenosine(37)-N6)-dimethylallyltransferase MiaA [Flavobacterium sp.]|uniref:tRNA (adenosine(37)-N6)-dimethylallyltransferase MiaA n=1 Tax=Flavobacterium sp. TaxID=239 RepID=UPI0025FA0F8B|nr:tRNA (adenosine(37)-N6)-dimethylallyltransferase MiaA [Flavobacterium sp.]